jgi:hypothetical protein
MHAITSNHLQQQIIPVQQRVSGSSSTGVEPPRKDKWALPEDIVNLSMMRSLNLDATAKKNPSVPVSAVERKALQESFSVYA